MASVSRNREADVFYFASVQPARLGTRL